MKKKQNQKMGCVGSYHRFQSFCGLTIDGSLDMSKSKRRGESNPKNWPISKKNPKDWPTINFRRRV